MSEITSREWRLKSRPVGMPKQDDFEIASVSVPAPGEGQVQVRNNWMSVDPYMRGRMMDRESYVPPFELGKALQGGAVGEVTASGHPDYKVGDKVRSMLGWREAFTASPEEAMLEKLPETPLPEQVFLGVVGMPGLTAYAGLLRIGEPKEGDVVFVSGAAGAVGSLVCQIAKIKGCTVIGSAGGQEKCDYLRSIGVDEVIDYRQHSTRDALVGALKAAAPKGIDIYFDNVGGDHLYAAIEAARPFARLIECGMISQYNATEEAAGPSNIIQVVGKQLKMQGFIVSTHADMAGEFVKDMSTWIPSGQIKYTETTHEGVDNAVNAFLGLFTGGNTGKMLVKLA